MEHFLFNVSLGVNITVSRTLPPPQTSHLNQMIAALPGTYLYMCLYLTPYVFTYKLFTKYVRVAHLVEYIFLFDLNVILFDIYLYACE
jgi:hypothetical protein